MHFSYILFPELEPGTALGAVPSNSGGINSFQGRDAGAGASQELWEALQHLWKIGSKGERAAKELPVLRGAGFVMEREKKTPGLGGGGRKVLSS